MTGVQRCASLDSANVSRIFWALVQLGCVHIAELGPLYKQVLEGSLLILVASINSCSGIQVYCTVFRITCKRVNGGYTGVLFF